MIRVRHLLTPALLGCSLLFATTVLAQEGDAAAGEGKASVCAACHGIDGNSSVPTWPNLAGQHADYLARQVMLIRDGARNVPEMTGIAAGLSDQDIADLAAYYAAQTPKPGVADESLVERGERVWQFGNAETNVPACMACHGPAGAGNPLAGYPRLAGQHAEYTASMLNKFRDGTTWGPDDASSAVMVGVAKGMTDAEIEAVSSYIAGLHSTIGQ